MAPGELGSAPLAGVQGSPWCETPDARCSKELGKAWWMVSSVSSVGLHVFFLLFLEANYIHISHEHVYVMMFRGGGSWHLINGKLEKRHKQGSVDTGWCFYVVCFVDGPTCYDSLFAYFPTRIQWTNQSVCGDARTAFVRSCLFEDVRIQESKYSK